MGFQLGGPDSLLRSLFLYPLLPGVILGFGLTGHGGNVPLAFLICVVVNALMYWGLWQFLLALEREDKRASRKVGANGTDVEH